MDSEGRKWMCRGRKERKKRITKEILKGIRKKEVSSRGR